MLVPGSVNPLLLTSAASAAGGGISRSLRCNSADSAYLSRTPGSAGNRRTWTWAGWVKRSALGSTQALMTVEGNSDSTTAQFWFSSDDKFRFGIETADIFVTDAVFRDCSAWYHIVFAFDATNAASANKMILYVNGVRQTTSTYTAPSNTDYGFNRASAIHSIGRRQNNADWYFNGYLADCYLVDGQQLDPTSFTETDATTGQLIPKAFSGSYGTNGFHLTFSDNSGTTSTTLGKDSAGSNNWTPNNFSVSSGAGNDSLVDVPTNGSEVDAGVGGEVRGNYCTLNPLKYGGDIQAPTNGNLDVTSVGSATGKILGTIGVSSGKWYWECVPNSSVNIAFGITKDNTVLANYPGQDAVDYSYHNDGSKYSNNSGSAYGATFTTNDIIGVAFDADNGTLTFYKNNSSQGQAYSGLTSGPYFPMVGDPSSTPDISATVNFGARAFSYTAPSGFKALCTANLPAPLVTKPNTVMDVKLYTGNGSTQTVSGLLFSPDFVWIKSRSTTDDSRLLDTVRGATNTLFSSLTNAETVQSNGLTAFNSDGFSLGNHAAYNLNNATFAGWCWDAGTSTVTNTAGSITSSVRANPTAGFSVCTFSVTTANSISTFGTGLGVSPEFVIIKPRNTTTDWAVFHNSATSTPLRARLLLNSSGAVSTYGYDAWSRSSTTFGVYTSILAAPGTAIDCVAYCFAPVVGYSSFGSYTGNGSSTDNTFVYTGMRPRFVMLKRSDSTGNWVIWDAVRNSYNVANSIILPNSSAAEYSPDAKIDILSNGFKVRDNSSDSGTNGATYIYAAFAESPFNYARAR